MSAPVTQWLLLSAVAIPLVVAQASIVATHPEPGDDVPDAHLKPRYADLVRPGGVSVLLVLAVTGCLPIAAAPPAVRPAWVVWTSAVLVLVYVDARTTWLPIRANHFAAACLIAAVAAGLIIDPAGWPAAALRAIGGAAAAGGLFWLPWRLSNSLGFGDVRLAAMTGALAALGSVQWWFLAIFAGSVASACWGLITALWRRRHPSPYGRAFPYGPGLWLGPWLAWAWLAATGSIPVAAG